MKGLGSIIALNLLIIALIIIIKYNFFKSIHINDTQQKSRLNYLALIE